MSGFYDISKQDFYAIVYLIIPVIIDKTKLAFQSQGECK